MVDTAVDILIADTALSPLRSAPMSVGSFRHVIAASLLLAASSHLAAAQAQTGTVSGTVTGEIGQPIAGAQVALVEAAGHLPHLEQPERTAALVLSE